jgi:hypothetical protein
MAMKKVFFFVIAPIVFLVGVLFLFMAITREKPPGGIKLALVDTVTKFPKEAARKELGMPKNRCQAETVEALHRHRHSCQSHILSHRGFDYLDAVCSTGSEVID